MWSIDDILRAPESPSSRFTANGRSTASGSRRAAGTLVRPEPYHRPRALVQPSPSPLADVTNNGLGARFVSPIPQSELQDLCKPFIPNRTKSNNTWATRVGH